MGAGAVTLQPRARARARARARVRVRARERTRAGARVRARARTAASADVASAPRTVRRAYEGQVPYPRPRRTAQPRGNAARRERYAPFLCGGSPIHLANLSFCLVGQWRFAPQCCAWQSVCWRPPRTSVASTGRSRWPSRSGRSARLSLRIAQFRQIRKPLLLVSERCRFNHSQMQRPNPSLKRSPNGRPPGPVWWYAVHFHQPGPGVPPSGPA